MRRALLWIWAVLLTPVVLFLVVLLLLYCPPVQNYVVQKVVAYASEELGATISVDYVTLAFPLDLSIEGVKYIQPNEDDPSILDTIADIRSIVVDVRLMPLFDGVAEVKRVEILDASVNTSNMVEAARVRGHVGRIYLRSRGITWGEGEAWVDDAILSDADIDIALNDSVPEDTTASEPVMWTIMVSRFDLDNTAVSFHTAGDSINISTLLGGGSVSDARIDLGNSIYTVGKVRIKDDRLRVADVADEDVLSMSEGVSMEVDSLYMDTLSLSMSKALIELPSSRIEARVCMDLNAFDEEEPGSMAVDAVLYIGRDDVEALAGLEIGSDIEGTAKARKEGQRYSAEVELTEGSGGRITIDGYYCMDDDSYKATANIDGVDLRHFMEGGPMRTLTADAEVEGRGLDIYSEQTRIDARIALKAFQYDTYNLGSIEAAATLAGGKARVDIDSKNSMAVGTIGLEAMLSRKKIDATLGLDISRADLQEMGLVDSTFAVGVCSHVDLTSDLSQSHSIQAGISDIVLSIGEETYTPQDIDLDLYTTPDTTRATLLSGDLSLDFQSHGGYETLMGKVDSLLMRIEEHQKEKIIDGEALRELLPTMRLRMAVGTENMVAKYVGMMGVGFTEAAIDLRSSPERGIGGRMYAYRVEMDSIRVDTINIGFRDDMSRLGLRARVRNNPDNQLCFTALVDAYLEGREIGLAAQYRDKADSLGLSLGLKAEMCDSGISVRVDPLRPVLGYIPFNVNEDNYVFLGKDKKVRADINVITDDGTGAQIYSAEEEDPTLLQDLTVSLSRVDLGKILSVIPYAPSVEGMLNGDLHVVQDETEHISVLSDLVIDGLKYEQWPMGNIGMQLVYMQRDNDTHAVRSILTRNDEEVCTVDGSYRNDEEGYIDATMTMARFPLSLANGFIPDQIVGFDGYGNGVMSMKGPVSQPLLNGSLMLDSAYIKSIPYGVTLRFDDGEVGVENSRLTFDEYKLFSLDNDPLSIKGYVDCSDLERMSMDIAMRTKNYKIIDSKKTTASIAYGKAYVDFGGRIYGGMDNLRMRGTVNVLGNTDMTYILKNSALTTENYFDGLVTFTDFNDTTQVQTISRPPVGGFDMNVTLEVEQGARIVCALNTDESNYVKLEGGGELTITYNEEDDMQLFGKYTLTEGEMKYALPVIPLKTFQIEEGSYVEFSGDMMNPALSLAATEDIKALVSSESGDSHSVLFQCGVKVSGTLQNMGLQFTLETDDDLTVKNELASMNDEERGKVAVTMLTTGMYLTGDNTSAFSMSNALNSFLQNEINNITNSAVRSFDLSLGIDQGADASGQQYTDYTFKFSKKLWNNRVNFVIGGKVSDGSSSSDESGTMIDNVSLEYRLDNTSMRYVRLFYTKDSHDILEDDISQYGAGFVWRKKMDKFSELFKSTKTK